MENILLANQLKETGSLKQKRDFSRLVELERTKLPYSSTPPI
jgi:hypothetical protein